MKQEEIKNQILKIFANNPFDAFNHKQISSRIGANSKAERQAVIRAMQELAKEKALIEDDHKGKYKINPKSIDDLLPKSYVVGTIDMKQGGKAYVIPHEEGREDIQISPNNTHHALHGDTVRVLMFPQRKLHKPEGQVVEILKRAKSRFVGVLQKQERFAFMVSDSRTMNVDIFIHVDDLGGAENGEKVLVEMTDWPERMNNPVGKVVKRLGRPGDNNVEMQSILAEYDFPLDFPSDVESEAKKIKKPTKKEISGRRDFRDVLTFTIDPADAKDFDDALSFRELENGHVEVGVHIADVSHYVKPGSAIDREAYERGTSVYLVDRTIPMLPEKLCNEVCSLRQDEEKLCFSVVMEMDAKGKVLSSWMGKTVINSNRRMAYEEAQEIIESGQGVDAVGEAVLKLHAIATQLRAARYKSGAINFETQEVKFQLDENAKPIGVYIKESKEANWLIEEFMLLANKTVAEFIGKPSGKTGKTSSTRTFVYRVHDEPNPEKLNTFVEFVAKLGFSMKTSSRKALAESYNRLFENIAGRGEEHMVDTIAIRTMSKAYYSTENIGHYGLAFPYYTHFTSPIRRYPDLMVHRLLEYYLGVKGSERTNEKTPNREIYEDYCKHCSIMEKKAADAERTSVKYKQAEFLADKLGQVFPALISGVSKWGIYAEIEGNKCEGMIPIGSLKDDYYMLDEDNYQVIGRRHGKCYKLGYPVHIRVKRVDMLKKQIDFELVDEEELNRPQHPAPTKGKATKKGTPSSKSKSRSRRKSAQ